MFGRKKREPIIARQMEPAPRPTELSVEERLVNMKQRSYNKEAQDQIIEAAQRNSLNIKAWNDSEFLKFLIENNIAVANIESPKTNASPMRIHTITRARF